MTNSMWNYLIQWICAHFSRKSVFESQWRYVLYVYI